MLIKINSKNIKDLSNVGVSPTGIRLLENAQKSGKVLRSPADLSNLGLSVADIELIKPQVSFSPPEPETEIKLATIQFAPAGLIDYLLVIETTEDDAAQKVTNIFRIGIDGKASIKYDNKGSVSVVISVKGPSGELAATTIGEEKATFHTIAKKNLDKLKIKIEPFLKVTTSLINISRPIKIKGRLISNNSENKKEKIKIVFFVATELKGENIPDFYPVCFAETEADGYFFSSVLSFRGANDYRDIIEAKAVLSISGNPAIGIRLQYDGAASPGSPRRGQLPEKVILFFEETENADASKECDCGCSDLNFHDKKVLEEFSYYTVVRTTEPLIKATEIKDDDEVNFEDISDGIIDDPRVKAAIAGVRAPVSLFKKFISKNGFVTTDNVGSLINQSKLYALTKRLNKPGKSTGRASLDADVKVDWDENPTIYEAITIAHGHLLHFKQEWHADGYSIGDLLYSLPLAPGQKKQIVVFDWDRKDSASNTQRLDYQESLYNSLSRDRDVNEVANATLKEKSFGGSIAGVGGGGSGIGGIISGLIVGVAGGFGIGASVAGQSSSRNATASSQQQVHDRSAGSQFSKKPAIHRHSNSVSRRKIPGFGRSNSQLQSLSCHDYTVFRSAEAL